MKASFGGFVGSDSTISSTGTFESLPPVSFMVVLLPGLATEEAGSNDLSVDAFKLAGTFGTTTKLSDFLSALSASTDAVLVRFWPSRSGEMSSSTLTGILMVMWLRVGCRGCRADRSAAG